MTALCQNDMDCTGGCAGFGWDRVHVLHSSWCGAMFRICAETRVDNTEMLLLLLSSAYTESRPFLLLTPPHQRGGWGCTRSPCCRTSQRSALQTERRRQPAKADAHRHTSYTEPSQNALTPSLLWDCSADGFQV